MHIIRSSKNLQICIVKLNISKERIFLFCKQEAQSYADDNSLLFMETSAKTSMNVNEIFMAIGKMNNACFQII